MFYPFHRRSNTDSKQNRKRRSGRIIMFADLVLIALIFAYVSYYKGGPELDFGKAVQLEKESVQLKMSAHYLDKLDQFAVFISLENLSKERAELAFGTTFRLEMKLGGHIIISRTWPAPKEMEAYQVKNFQIELSMNFLQSLFTKYPELVEKAKRDSFISFDLDKLRIELLLHNEHEILLSKKVTIEKEERNRRK